MTSTILSYMDESFWVSQILKDQKIQIDRNQSGLIDLLKVKPEQENQEFQIASQGNVQEDNLGVLGSLNKQPNIKSFQQMQSFNQLGIKDYLLQKSAESSLHTRLNHSVGTALVGTLYFYALEPFIDFTIFKNMSINREEVKKLLNFALYLHDVGHLPFSHSMEEVLRELNWTRLKGKSFRHDEVPLEQLRDEDKQGIGQALKEVFGDERGSDYFEFVQDLIGGISGVPFLDAIVNSSIDADKIDYIFRDMRFTRTRARMREEREWLRDFFSSISLSPEGFIRLNGEASLCALELLEERQFLYRNLYLRPDIRAFEKIAKVILTSWLTRYSSKVLLDLLEDERSKKGFIQLEPDLRNLKGIKAANEIMERFYKETKVPRELNFLIKMAEELELDNSSDDRAKNWFGKIKIKLNKFNNSSEDSKILSKDKDTIEIVEEPFYLESGEDAKKAKEIARNIYVDYPCGILIDIVDFPRFLPSSRTRRFHFHNNEIISDTFLVPDREPSEWCRSKIGRFPLHLCDFTKLEKNFAQVIVINTEPEEVRGIYFYDLFRQRCRAQNIELSASIWR